MPLPPGPRTPPVGQTLAWIARPERFMERARDRYGDVFTVRLAAVGTLVFVSDPALLRPIFTADANVLRAGAANASLEPVMGPSSVLLLDAGDQRRERQVLAAAALALLLAGILLSVTRLALFALVGEVVLMSTFMRRWWLNALVVLVLIGVVAVIFGYPRIGPVMDSHLQPTQVRAGIVSAGDPSFLEHVSTVLADLKVAVTHPMGEGLGSSGSSAVRFAGAGSSADYAPGESAVLTMFVDTGVIGGVAYLALYLFGLIQAVSALLRTQRRGLEAALPMVAVVGGLALIPITMTSDLWGDFSVTFLFWWAVGSSASTAFGYVPSRGPAREGSTRIAAR